MKRYILVIAFAVLALLLTACTEKAAEETTTAVDVTTAVQTDEYSVTSFSETDTEAETFAETLAEESTIEESVTLPTVEITFNEYKINGGMLELSYSADGADGKYSLSSSDGTVIDINVPSNGKLNFKVASDNNAEIFLTSAECELDAKFILKNSLPQLTKSDIPLVINEMTDEELARLCIGDWTTVQGSGGSTYAIERFGIPKMVLADGPAGVRWSTHTVWYPSSSVIASSWDTEIVAKIGQSIGEDCETLGIDVILGPGMNIQRSVLGGRNFEYFSEDPYLTGIIASAYTNGVQSTGTGVSAKHYAVNNQETSRGSVSSELTERALREIYLRGFGYLVKYASPYTVMSSYNKVNGTYSSTNSELLSILREEFGFDGLIVSDWVSLGSSDAKIAAGNDLSEPGEQANLDSVLNALKNGTLTRKECETAVGNILGVIVRSNSYKNMSSDKKEGGVKHSEQVDEALAGAEAGIVLLKNSDSTLPYASGNVTLLGKGSYNTIFGGSGSGGVNISSSYQINIYKGIKSCGDLTLNDTVTKKIKASYDKGQSECNETVLSAINTESKNGGLVVITISRETSEGVDHNAKAGDFYLSDDELQLIKETSESFRKNGGKLAVLLNTGNPVEVASWEEYADAIIWIGMAGEQTGVAVNNIITGKVNPSGKLTCTWPVSYSDVPYSQMFPGSAAYTIYNEDIYVGYRFNTTFGIKAQYDFGYGLSYTSFEYSDIKLSEGTFDSKDSTITVSVTVKNTGACAGREVVELYVSKPSTDLQEQAAYELCGFAKTGLLQPGESQTVTMTVTADELMTYFESASDWVIVSGEYKLSVGASVGDIKEQLKFNVSGNITVRDVTNKCVNQTEIKVLTQKEGYTPTAERKSLTGNATATANADEGGLYPAANVCDGDTSTRWSGVGSSGDHVLTVDLGSVCMINEIEIVWESNNSNHYEVNISEDGNSWNQVCSTDMTIWATDSIKLDSVSARYIKITVPARATWCSIYEIGVYGLTDS